MPCYSELKYSHNDKYPKIQISEPLRQSVFFRLKRNLKNNNFNRTEAPVKLFNPKFWISNDIGI